MRLEIFIVILLLILYFYANSYLSFNSHSLFIVRNYKTITVGLLFLILLMKPSFFKDIFLFLFSINEKKTTQKDIIEEFNFVNNVRSITDHYQNHNQKLEDEKKNFVLGIQKYACKDCKIILEEANSKLDYIIPITRGGSIDTKNLQVLCIDCYKKKFMFDKLL